jgi:hypothetical protein
MAQTTKGTLPNEENQIKSEWEDMVTKRQPYLDRARTYSKLTLKYLYPDVSQDSETSTLDLQGDWQIDGPLLTNHLANMYMQTLFPPNRSFFKLNLSAEDMAGMAEGSGLSKAAVEFALSRAEDDARKLMLNVGGRPALLDSIKHIIVSGNALIYYPEKGKMQAYALDEFCVQRDPDGEITSLITRDNKGFLTLPEDMRNLVRTELNIRPEDEEKTNVNLYTRVKLSPDSTDTENPNYIIQQAVDQFPFAESEVTMTRNELRWIPIGWHRTRRESYYRGLVELIYPALYNVSVLTEAVVKGIAVITDIKLLVEPDSIIDIPTLNSSGPGTYHYGEAGSVNPVQVGNIGDWSFITNVIDQFVAKLSKAFLMAVPRNSERTTAEEIRLMMRELETSHGGVFGVLSQTLQLQLSRLLLKGIELDLNGTSLEPVILTGMDAMGRSANNDNMRMFAEDLTMYDAIPDAFKDLIVARDMFIDLASGRDVDFTRWTKTPEDLEADAQAQAQAQAQSLLMQEGAKGMQSQVANMPQDQAMEMAGQMGGPQ